MTTLREAGWAAEVATDDSPVQVLGVLPCGEEFYFRSRHDHLFLAVGGDGTTDPAPWERWVPYGEPGQSEASYLTVEPGLSLLLGLAAEHLATCQHAADASTD